MVGERERERLINCQPRWKGVVLRMEFFFLAECVENGVGMQSMKLLYNLFKGS